VEDHRQIVAFRQPQLRLKYRNLTRKLRIFPIEIETDLPNRDQLSVAFRQAGFKPFKTLCAMPFNRYRMQA
jgi:hypothetical protein